MRAALYCRVSDDKLKLDGDRRQDVQRQVDRLKSWPEAKGEAYDVYKDDGISAFKEDYNARPGFLRMMREIKAMRIQKVYVESLDRISRRISEGLPLLEEIGNNSCQVFSIAEGEIDITSSPGWLRTGIFLLMAEWASRDKSDKVKSAMDRRRNDDGKICPSCGVVHMGRHPLTCLCLICKKRVGRI